MRFGVLVQKDMVTAALGCLQFSSRPISARLIAPLNASFTKTDDPTSGHDNNYCTPDTGQHTVLPASSEIVQYHDKSHFKQA